MAYFRVGKIRRLYPHSGGCYIYMPKPPGEYIDDDNDFDPKFNYFLINISHENYNSLYSLALVAAVNGYKMKIRAYEDFDPEVIAEVSYLTVDWDE